MGLPFNPNFTKTEQKTYHDNLVWSERVSSPAEFFRFEQGFGQDVSVYGVGDETLRMNLDIFILLLIIRTSRATACHETSSKQPVRHGSLLRSDPTQTYYIETKNRWRRYGL